MEYISECLKTPVAGTYDVIVVGGGPAGIGAALASASPAIVVPETLDPINLLGVLRRARGSFVIVTNEFGVVQGLVTPLDVLEAIAGEFPDADETPELSMATAGLLRGRPTCMRCSRRWGWIR